MGSKSLIINDFFEERSHNKQYIPCTWYNNIKYAAVAITPYAKGILPLEDSEKDMAVSYQTASKFVVFYGHANCC
jgi:hypothetical protein